MKNKNIINLVENKISDAVVKSHDSTITKDSKKLKRNSLETVTNEHDKEIPKERYISPKERQKVMDNLDINIIVE